MLLKGKTAIITGADRGIGKAIALCYAKQGARVVVGYRSGTEGAKSTVSEITAQGGNARAIYVDVAQNSSIQPFLKEALLYLGQIDILVNNAGITRDQLLIRMSEAEWDSVLNVNLKSAFLLTKEVSIHMMKQKKGSIIQISSVVGETGNGGQANYAAAKAGLIGLTKTAALEMGRKNIRINAIAPGFIETAMTKTIPEEKRASFYEKIPLRRAGAPEDVANTALFLASDWSSYITGQVLNVDGGMVMQG